jgi:hypothetical protein
MFDLKRFPFIVKNRHVIVHAQGYRNALDRVLMKHPNKFIKTKHAKNMDLINAQKQAKENSKTNKGQLFYVILTEDEFEVKDFMQVKDTDDTYSIWRDGAKIDSPNGKKEDPLKAEKKIVNEVNKQLTNKTMETKEKSPAKKVAAKKEKPAKKVAAKKVAAPKKKAAAKKNGAARKFEPGKIVSISIADMIKNINKGLYFYRDPQGVRQTVKYMKTRANQDYVREGMHQYKTEKA